MNRLFHSLSQNEMPMRSLTRLITLISFLLLISLHAPWAWSTENEITLGTQKPLDSPSGTFLNLVYTEAFRRIGYKLIYQTFPAKRSSLLSDNGTLDGELSRIYSYNDIHPNLIRIEEPHWTSGFIVVSTDKALKLHGWNSLKNTDYKVVFMAGIKGCETNLPKVVKPENLESVSHTSHGLRMLLKQRADIHIGAEMDILSLLESDEFKSSGLYIIGELERFTGHAFLHNKHEALVPKLSAVLNDMKNEGLLNKYRMLSKLKTTFTDHP